jgi:hypothetical protein
MTTLELLEQHPKTTTLIKEWFLDKLLASMNAAIEVPDDFKEMLRAQPIENSNVEKMIDGMPRSLFDFFDCHEIVINTIYKDGWTWSINDNNEDSMACVCRTEAEYDAIIVAFKMLEDNL